MKIANDFVHTTSLRYISKRDDEGGGHGALTANGFLVPATSTLILIFKSKAHLGIHGKPFPSASLFIIVSRLDRTFHMQKVGRLLLSS